MSADKVSETEALSAARRIGLDAQLCKPFTADILREVVDAVLDAPPIVEI